MPEKELKVNLPELQKHGLLMSFTSDVFLPQSRKLTIDAAFTAVEHNVPVMFLTKIAINPDDFIGADTRFVSFGFTLAGRDDMEPGASTNAECIEAMRKLHEAGFRTWASIEPIIDFQSSFDMIRQTALFCNHYKIGLLKGKKYDKHDIRVFVERCLKYSHLRNLKLYFKDSLLKAAGIERSALPDKCVDRNFKLFINNHGKSCR